MFNKRVGDITIEASETAAYAVLQTEVDGERIDIWSCPIPPKLERDDIAHVRAVTTGGGAYFLGSLVVQRLSEDALVVRKSGSKVGGMVNRLDFLDAIDTLRDLQNNLIKSVFITHEGTFQFVRTGGMANITFTSCRDGDVLLSIDTTTGELRELAHAATLAAERLNS